MAAGNEIIDYKNKVIKDILHNDDELLSYEIVNAINPDYIGSEDDLIYTHVFPYLRIPEVQDEEKCYITMSVDMPRVSTKNYFFKNMVITINVIVQQDVMKMPAHYSATRMDYIASIINKIFNGNKNYGLVPLEYVSDVEDVFLKDFFIRTMRFTCDEMNTVRC